MKLFEVVQDFFREEEWDFTEIEKNSLLQLGFSGEQGSWLCYAQIREENTQFIFYSVCPVKAPEASRNQIAEFITRANYGLLIGNFELDYSDGEIRYKTSVDAKNETLSIGLLRNLVYVNVVTFDKYLPGIMRIINDSIAPIEALREIEG